MQQVQIRRLVINERSDDQVLALAAEDGRELSIIIRLTEALAIDRILRGFEAGRPLTHELLLAVLEPLDAELARVDIDAIEDGVTRAKLELRRGDDEIRIDARPSDAVALALKAEAPIFVADELLEEPPAPLSPLGDSETPDSEEPASAASAPEDAPDESDTPDASDAPADLDGPAGEPGANPDET